MRFHGWPIACVALTGGLLIAGGCDSARREPAVSANQPSHAQDGRKLPPADQHLDDVWALAAQNARQAAECFSRSRRVMQAWYTRRGSGNALLPQNLNGRIWSPENSAADLWSFFVITSYLLDREAYEGPVRQTLIDEIRLTTRLGRLPDHYDIDRGAFAVPGRWTVGVDDVARLAESGPWEPLRATGPLPGDVSRVIFGASEYVKDGLLPIAELTGHNAWFERARGLTDDICAAAPVTTRFGRIPSELAEVNGNMLQQLCRLYTATGDPRYKQWAERIGDAYFIDMLPKSGGLPCHSWDFDAGKPRQDVLSLIDHGNEIIAGLSELAALEHLHDRAKADVYLPAMRRMIDRLLSVAVNDDGLWFMSIRPSDGAVLNRATPDTWGYALNAVYTLHLLTGDARYRDAVLRAMRGINAMSSDTSAAAPAYKYDQWDGADAFADAIESGVVLLNRVDEPQTRAWLERVVPLFLSKQAADGFVERWHGDGNYNRTALMVALMKTAGTRISAWRDDLEFGAVVVGDSLYGLVQRGVSDKSASQVSPADKPWRGRLNLDYPRHREHMGLSLNYPRLNEFPEWYTVQRDRLYDVTIDGVRRPAMLGDDLVTGLPLEVDQQPVKIVIRPAGEPPYGSRVVSMQAPPEQTAAGAFLVPIELTNDTGRPVSLRLATDFGDISPREADLPRGARLAARLSGDLARDGSATISAHTADGALLASRTIALTHGSGPAARITFNDESFAGRGYRWCGNRPIEFALPAPAAQPGRLRLLWGSKSDQRAAIVSVNGHEHRVAKGGYSGFEWLDVEIPAAELSADQVSIRIAPDAPHGRPAFIAEARLITSGPPASAPATAVAVATPRDARMSTFRHTETSFDMPEYRDRSAWQRRAAELREHILACCGLLPMPPRTPLNAQIFGEVDRGDYRIAKVYFESLPGFFVAGNLYRPSGESADSGESPGTAAPPWPAVLCPHGHWRHGRLEDSELGSIPGRCISLARQGYVVFSHDMIGFNDSLQLSHEFGGPREELWGISLMGLQLWNSIRAVDFLVSLPDVDPARIGCTGESGGGTQTFMLAAVEDRIACAAPVNMISATFQGGCLCENAPGLRVDTFNVEIAACMAPRPLLLVSCTQDWTKHTPTREFPMLERIYGLHGATPNLAQVQFDAPHNYNRDSREAVYRWFAQHLKHDPNAVQIREAPFQCEPAESMRVFPDAGSLPTSALAPTAVAESLIARARAMISDVRGRPPGKSSDDASATLAELAAALRHSLHVLLPRPGEIETEVLLSKNMAIGGGDAPLAPLRRTELVLTRRTVGDRVPGTLLVPESTRASAVLVVHAEGRGVLLDEPAETLTPLLRELLRDGHPLLLIDAFATGEAARSDAERQAAGRIRYFNTFNLTPLASQVQDVLTAAAFLAQSGLTDDESRVDMIGIGAAGPWVLLARSQSDLRGATVADVNQIDVGDDDVFLAHYFAPGLRRAGDFVTAVALCAPRPLLLHQLRAGFDTDWVSAVYAARGAAARLTLASQRTPDAAIAAYLRRP
ncbi:MAG: hypothetical protein CHACPFDD_00308 [Phycisphaerae bacterium]|nr:hypothetical protein [Phycisphaerae bacterium]